MKYYVVYFENECGAFVDAVFTTESDAIDYVTAESAKINDYEDFFILSDVRDYASELVY